MNILTTIHPLLSVWRGSKHDQRTKKRFILSRRTTDQATARPSQAGLQSRLLYNKTTTDFLERVVALWKHRRLHYAIEFAWSWSHRR